jgi:hypothetical protein
MTEIELLHWLLAIEDDAERFAELAKLNNAQREELATHWRLCGVRRP